MKYGVSRSLIKFTNKIFPSVVHPFNLANAGGLTYAEWQFEKGADTIACYSEKYTANDMFKGKSVLDMGCGAAGKSMYYISAGAARVVGVDIISHYEREAMAYAKKLGYSARFNFICASASDLPFPNNTFDTIIINDVMEHLAEPEAALNEALRLIKPDGRIFINFPPYYHPSGAHMSDAVNLPWAHMFFSESALIAAYKDLVKDLPDGAERINLRVRADPDGREYLGYINKMTLKRFKKILKSIDIKPVYYREIPLRRYFTPLAKLPKLKEMFVKMAVCVLVKPKE